MNDLLMKRRLLRELVNDRRTKQILSTLRLKNDADCLELGAGTGSIAAYLASVCQEGQIDAIDLNPENIEYIREQYAHIINLKTYVSDVHDPCYREKKYDFIHARFLFEHISDWKTIVQRLCKENLKPGGVILIEDADYDLEYVGEEEFQKIMKQYSKIVKGTSQTWNCTLETIGVLGECGLTNLNATGEIQTFYGGTVDSEYWKHCFLENKDSIIHDNSDERELKTVLQYLDCKEKMFSGPLVFHTYGKKADTRRIVNRYPAVPIKMVLTDCDGCLTDSGMYYSEFGDEIKKFNTKDGMGFAALKKHGIITGIITGENSQIVRARAQKLNVDVLRLGCQDKAAEILSICEEKKISLENVMYIGDDLNDIGALSVVGLSCCPADAIYDVKKIVTYITKVKGGEGVLREAADMALRLNRDTEI